MLEDCPVERLGVGRLRSLSTWRIARQFRQTLRRGQFDVVQTYFADSSYFGIPLARWAGVPLVLRTRNNLGYWMKRRDRLMARLVNSMTDATIANCEASREAMIADESYPTARVHVIQNGIDIETFQRISNEPFSNLRRPPCVGMIANLREVKTPDIFLEAAAEIAAEFPQVTFRLAGEGPLRPRLEHRIAELGLTGRFELVGLIDEPATFLAELDIAVLSSSSEGLSNAVMEYMASGRAIVATNVGAMEELIDNGVTGLLVPPGNPTELTAGITRLLRNHDVAKTMGAAARRIVQNRYDPQLRAQQFVQLYRSLLRRSRLRTPNAY